jgi:hypothetical protein
VTDGVLVHSAAGHLVFSPAGHLVYKDPVPNSCPGVPPLITSYDVAWTGTSWWRWSAFDPCFETFPSGALTANHVTSCTWKGTDPLDGQCLVEIKLLSSPNKWRARFYMRSGFGPEWDEIYADKLVGSTPAGVYAVTYRRTGGLSAVCGSNTIDDIVVTD